MACLYVAQVYRNAVRNSFAALHNSLALHMENLNCDEKGLIVPRSPSAPLLPFFHMHVHAAEWSLSFSPTPTDLASNILDLLDAWTDAVVSLPATTSDPTLQPFLK